jgi:hypothetical protein
MTFDATQEVIAAIRAYQSMTDATPLRVTLAVAATSVLDDEPLWLQLVGAPPSGKSEAISMLASTVDGNIGDVSLPGLLGWSGGSGKHGRPTGLLARIGDGSRLVTITDFSTVVADSDHGRRAALFSLLRVLYDGYVIREIGSAPRPLEWRGRVTIVSGVTPQIDAFSAHADALGPRWLYCRVPDLDRGQRRDAGGHSREHAARKRLLREQAQQAALRAVQYARERLASVEIYDVDGEWIVIAADVATRARSDVPRDGYGSARARCRPSSTTAACSSVVTSCAPASIAWNASEPTGAGTPVDAGQTVLRLPAVMPILSSGPQSAPAPLTRPGAGSPEEPR